jgi:hypothetical protein
MANNRRDHRADAIDADGSSPLAVFRQRNRLTPSPHDTRKLAGAAFIVLFTKQH